MELFIKLLVLIHPNKMVLLSEKNRHLLEVVQSLLIKTHMHLSYWGEALTFVACFINQASSSSNNF